MHKEFRFGQEKNWKLKTSSAVASSSILFVYLLTLDICNMSAICLWLGPTPLTESVAMPTRQKCSGGGGQMGLRRPLAESSSVPIVYVPAPTNISHVVFLQLYKHLSTIRQDQMSTRICRHDKKMEYISKQYKSCNTFWNLKNIKNS